MSEKPTYEELKKRVQDNESKYKNLLTNIPDIIYSLDNNAKISSINIPADSDFGYTSDEILGKDFMEFVHPDDRERVVASFMEALETRREWTRGLQFRSITKDDRVHWMEANTHMHLDKNDQFIGEEGVLRNIDEHKQMEKTILANQQHLEKIVEKRTYSLKQKNDELQTKIEEKKRMEVELRESEEKYRLIAENMADIITVMDMDLNFTYVSPSVLKLRGFTVEEAMKQSIDQIMTPESFQRASETFDEELRLEETGTADPDRHRIMELEEYKKNGSIIWVENKVSFIRDEDQKPVGILVVSRDISERKQAEDALRDSEAQYRLLADNVSDVIWTMDMKQGFTYTSPSVQKILGYTPEEALQVPLTTVLTPESYEKAVQVITKAIARDGEPGVSPDVTLTLELEHIRKDGSTLWTEMTTSFIRNEEGLPSGFIGITRDITERRQAEEQRDKLISDLQKALDEVKTLSGLLPICSYCKSIRDDKGYWNKIESYFNEHSDTQFSHGICPECAKKHYPDMDLFGDAE